MLLQLSRYQKDIRNNIHPIKGFNYWVMHFSAKLNTRICTILIELINILIKMVYFLCDEKKKLLKIGVYRLSTIIIGKLRIYYPDLEIVKSQKILGVFCDIYIPEYRLGFIFKVTYNNEMKIKQAILDKIRTCTNNDIKLYVFDIDQNDKFPKKKIMKLTYEIYGKIEKQIFLKNSFLMNNFN